MNTAIFPQKCRLGFYRFSFRVLPKSVFFVVLKVKASYINTSERLWKTGQNFNQTLIQKEKLKVERLFFIINEGQNSFYVGKIPIKIQGLKFTGNYCNFKIFIYII